MAVLDQIRQPRFLESAFNRPLPVALSIQRIAERLQLHFRAVKALNVGIELFRQLTVMAAPVRLQPGFVVNELIKIWG